MLTGYFVIPSAKGAAVAVDLAGVRGVFMGGQGPSTNVIDYITITTTGNATDFGDMTAATESNGGGSSNTRSLSAGGEITSGRSNIIEYVTILTTGNGTDFGDLQAAAYWIAGTSNQTRALFGTGTESSGASSSRMSYVTIATTGNAETFGTATTTSGKTRGMGGASSSTRALFFGGMSSVNSSVMDEIIYFTIASTGNATDFGDLTVARAFMSGGASSGTRVLIAGGNGIGETNTGLNTIDFVTIASTGNATDFGDLTFSAQTGTTSTITRAVHPRTSGNVNNMDFTTIATAGNGTDFGDLTLSRSNGMSCTSNGHGGLL